MSSLHEPVNISTNRTPWVKCHTKWTNCIEQNRQYILEHLSGIFASNIPPYIKTSDIYIIQACREAVVGTLPLADGCFVCNLPAKNRRGM